MADGAGLQTQDPESPSVSSSQWAGQLWAKCNHQSHKVLPGSSSTCRSSHTDTTPQPSTPTALQVSAVPGTYPFGHQEYARGTGQKQKARLSKNSFGHLSPPLVIAMEGLSQKPPQTQPRTLHKALHLLKCPRQTSAYWQKLKLHLASGAGDVSLGSVNFLQAARLLPISTRETCPASTR